MWGIFQSSRIRIEVAASLDEIRDSFLMSERLKQWLWLESFPSGLPPRLESGLKFTTKVGIIPIQHQVLIPNSHCLRFILSQGIDGYHDWCWSDGWVQSSVEGVSVIPINLGQTVTLWSLGQFLAKGK